MRENSPCGRDAGGVAAQRSGGAMLRHVSFVALLFVAPPAIAAPPDFDRQIAPLLAARFLDCHSGLSLSPEADRRVLIRRAYFDLIGLPPTPEEVDAFVNDKAPNAYEKVVDRLLASPHYGERWARHWLDVVRYGETDGFERNTP